MPLTLGLSLWMPGPRPMDLSEQPKQEFLYGTEAMAVIEVGAHSVRKKSGRNWSASAGPILLYHVGPKSPHP